MLKGKTVDIVFINMIIIITFLCKRILRLLTLNIANHNPSFYRNYDSFFALNYIFRFIITRLSHMKGFFFLRIYYQWRLYLGGFTVLFGNAWRENRVFSILFLVPVAPVAVKPSFFVFGINLETLGTRLIWYLF